MKREAVVELLSDIFTTRRYYQLDMPNMFNKYNVLQGFGMIYADFSTAGEKVIEAGFHYRTHCIE